MELHRIVTWVCRHFQLGDVRRSVALAEMVWGLLNAGVVSFAAIGRCMSGAATAASCIKRVFRFCHNDGVDPRAVQAALVHLFVGRTLGSINRLVQIATVTIDWHSYDNGDVSGLRVSLATGSRALPLLWYEVKTADRKGQQTAMELQAVRDLILYRPPGVTWLALLDSGFNSTEVVELLEQAGYFVLRNGIRRLVHSSQDCWTRVGQLPVRVGQVVDFGWVHWTANHPRVVRIVVARLYDKKKATRGRRSTTHRYRYSAPGLCIVATNLPMDDFNAVAVIRLYGRRFEIEHSFRDLKNASLGMDMEHVHLHDPATYSRLMCIVAIAEALLWLTGSEAESRSLHLRYTPSRPRAKRRILSLRNLGHLCLAVVRGAIGRLIRVHLRRALVRVLTIVGTNWTDVTDRRELRELAKTREDLQPIPRSCRHRKIGESYKVRPEARWRLTNNIAPRLPVEHARAA